MTVSKNKTLILLLFIVFVMMLLHISGIYLHLYYRISYYDTIVHTIGGLWIALASMSLAHTYQVIGESKKKALVIGICFTIVIGILWELFEYTSGVTSFGDSGFWPDTYGDIIADVVGGIIGSGLSITSLISWNKKI